MLHQVTATQTSETIMLPQLGPITTQTNATSSYSNSNQRYIKLQLLRPMLHQVTATQTSVTSGYSNSDQCYIKLQPLRPVKQSCYHNWDLLQLRQLYSVQLLRQANNENNRNI